MAKSTPATQPIPQKNHGMVFFNSFFVVLIVNLLVIYFANQWFPSNIVLGTMSLTPFWALFLVSSFIAMATVLTIPFFQEWEMRRKKILSPAEWMMGYFAINFVIVWLLTRVAEVFGMGVSSIIVVGILAAVLDFAQGMAMMSMSNQKK